MSNLTEAPATDLSCEPTEGEVCDLSAKIGSTVVASAPVTTVAAPQTTVLVDSAGPTIAPAPQLPATGSSNGPLALLGAALMLFGGLLLLSTRRPTIA